MWRPSVQTTLGIEFQARFFQNEPVLKVSSAEFVTVDSPVWRPSVQTTLGIEFQARFFQIEPVLKVRSAEFVTVDSPALLNV